MRGLLATVLFTICTLSATARAEIRIAAGPVDDPYYLVADRLKLIIETHLNDATVSANVPREIEVKILTTKGSKENVKLLMNEKANYALVLRTI